MAVSHLTTAVAIDDPSQVAQARRAGAALARAIGLDEERAGRLAQRVGAAGVHWP